MANLLDKILKKITYSSTIFWETHLHCTPEKIFKEKIAATLHFKNKLTKDEHFIELDVEQFQWYSEDKSSWESFYLDSLRDSRDKVESGN